MEAKSRLGRFIKRRDPVLRKVHVVEFNFEEICSSPLVSFDNADSTIVHARYHQEAELAANVHKPDRFEEILVDPSGRRPVLRPLDFTRDWEKEKNRRKHRSSRNSDEDDYDFDGDLYGQDARDDGEEVGDEDGIVEGVAEDTPPDELRTTADQTEESAPVDESLSEQQGMEIVGKAIKGLRRVGDQPEPNTPVEIGAAQPPVVAEETDFIPVQTSTAAGEVFDPEQSAAELYKQRKALSNEELEKVRSEAHEAGYLEGFKLGEEKGEIQVRQNATQVFARLNELLVSFRGLKHQILDNTQDNFYELAQAIAETLIGHELKLNPNTFVEFMRKVIRESVSENDFKIKVNPKTLQRLSKLEVPDLRDHFVKDEQVAEGDFVIDSKLTVVDVNVKKTIGELLDQADLSLFDAGEKAS